VALRLGYAQPTPSDPEAGDYLQWSDAIVLSATIKVDRQTRALA
jgi:hypothetical protein